MSKRSIQRAIWRKIGDDLDRPKGGLLPEWAGGVFVGLVVVAVVISFFM